MTPDYGSPLRVTWEVGDDPALLADLLKKIIEGRALFLEAEITGRSAEALAQAVSVGMLPLKLTLLGDAEALKIFADSTDKGANSEAVLFPPYPLVQEISTLSEKFKVLSLGLLSTREGLENFGDAIKLASGLGVGLSIVNPHAKAEPLTREHREKAKALWERLEVKPAATVHDLFLAEVLGLDPWKNYTGCAAGGALAHVTRDGMLTACRTLPVILGNLAEEGVKSLWKAVARQELRASLSEYPTVCGGCLRVFGCRGGCPGLADITGRDGSCPGIVKENGRHG